MTYETKLLACSGAVVCLLGVLIGAFGAHALNDLLVANQREHVFDLANRYQFYHGLAMLALAAVFAHHPKKMGIKWLSLLFTIGTLVFSGSLYVLALTNISWFGALTPIGGLLLLMAWLLSVLKIRSIGVL